MHISSSCIDHLLPCGHKSTRPILPSCFVSFTVVVEHILMISWGKLMNCVMIEVIQHQGMSKARSETRRDTDICSTVLLVWESKKVPKSSHKHLNTNYEILEVCCILSIIYKSRLGCKKNEDTLPICKENNRFYQDKFRNRIEWLK
uniref:Uncharacterized protein n=1 Tax=Opuntia streptacantha TaxID=393608 RepID=A0A7C8ZFI6_OPUST